jgi:WD40 repeat protein
VRGCAYSPDGRLILSASWDMTLKLWDAGNGWELATFKGHSAVPNCCAFSLDGRLIVSGAWNGEVKIWRVPSLDELLKMVPGRTDGSPGWTPETTFVTDFSPEAGKSGAVILTPWLNRFSGRLPWARLHFGCPHCLQWSSVPRSRLLKIDRCPACSKLIWLNRFFICGDWRSIATAWKKEA